MPNIAVAPSPSRGVNLPYGQAASAAPSEGAFDESLRSASERQASAAADSAELARKKQAASPKTGVRGKAAKPRATDEAEGDGQEAAEPAHNSTDKTDAHKVEVAAGDSSSADDAPTVQGEPKQPKAAEDANAAPAILPELPAAALPEPKAAVATPAAAGDAAPPDAAMTVSAKSAAAPAALPAASVDVPPDPANSFAGFVDRAVEKIDPKAVPTPDGSTSAAPVHVATAGGRQDATIAPANLPNVADPDVAQANQDRIVTGIRSHLLPNGGSMEIRLDPPEFGAMQVKVEMRNDVLSATFQASTDQGAQLLSQNLTQLRHAIEQQGITVEKLQVVHAPRADNSPTGDNSGQSSLSQQDAGARQQQQRREMLQRMWQRVTYGRDPVDLLA